MLTEPAATELQKVITLEEKGQARGSCPRINTEPAGSRLGPRAAPTAFSAPQGSTTLARGMLDGQLAGLHVLSGC